MVSYIDRLKELVVPLVEEKNAFLVDLTFHQSKFGNVVEVFIDSDSGVSTELCSSLSREFSSILNDVDFLQDRYNLVVSSPGLDRPLTIPRQYSKHIGRPLIIKRFDEGKMALLNGILIQVNEGNIILQLDDETQKELAFTEIIEAKVKPRW